MKFTLLLVGALAASMSSAHAKSCTDQGKLCATWAANPANAPAIAAAGATPQQAANRCTGFLTSKCKSDCKNGSKLFTGLGGVQHPIDTCN